MAPPMSSDAPLVAAGDTRCPACLYPRHVCLCPAIPTVVTRTRVVIVRHYAERTRSSNTGRLAHRALPNSVLIDHGAIEGAAVLPPLAGAWVLYPHGEPLTAAPAHPPTQIVALDASWSQARKMFRKLGALRGLPLFRLPDLPMPAARLRASPESGHVSTIEAIARALRILEGDAVATPLETLFALAVARSVTLGRAPARGA